ncbi:MAG: 3D domain-containing protein [Patescibacteria group bacterium]
MKKFFILLLTAFILTPSLAFAALRDADLDAKFDSGNTDEAAEFEANQARCQEYTCSCTWPQPSTGSGEASPGVYRADFSDILTEDACHSACTEKLRNDGDTFGLTQMTINFACNTLGAAGRTDEKPLREKIFPSLNVVIPGIGYTILNDGKIQWTKASIEGDGNKVTSNILGVYIKAWYLFLLGAATLVAVTMMMIGGLQYATARGDSNQVSAAKQRISNAVVGVILLLLAFNIAFIVNPATTTFDSLSVDYLPPAADSNRVAFNASTADQGALTKFKNATPPTSAELAAGVQFFITSYYAPAYGETGFGGISFECNIAMQCACPTISGKSSIKSCFSEKLNYSWAPCNNFSSSVPYCDVTTARRYGLIDTPPQAYRTAAVDNSYMPFGTVFKIFGAPDSAANAAIWYAEDTGAEIKGRRVDLFMGVGQSAYNQAIKNIGEVTLRTCPDNDPEQCPNTP